jgi:hypothetical protein
MPDRLRLCVFLLAWGWCAAPVRAEPVPLEGYLLYSGTATARHSAQFLYGERHVLLYRAGRLAERVVLYICRDGSPFARKTVSYVAAIAPDFLLEDGSNGLREGVRSAANERWVFFRESRTAAEKTGPLPKAAGLVVDAGFDDYIRANWEALMTGQSLDLPFLMPSRLGDIAFQLQHLRSEVIDHSAAEVFRLKVSGIVGWIAPGIDVSYATADRVLMRFDGVSDLRDASNHNYQTEINFRLTDRKIGSAQDMDNARQARLAPCK